MPVYFHKINLLDLYKPLDQHERVIFTEDGQELQYIEPTVLPTPAEQETKPVKSKSVTKAKSITNGKSAKSKSAKAKSMTKAKRDADYSNKPRKSKNIAMDWSHKIDPTSMLKMFLDAVCYFILPVHVKYDAQVHACDELTMEPRALGRVSGAHFLLRLFGPTMFGVALNVPCKWTVTNAQVKGYFLGKPRQVVKQRGAFHQLVAGSDVLETPKFTQSCNYTKQDESFNLLLTTSIEHGGYVGPKKKNKSNKHLPIMSQHRGWWAFEFQVEVTGQWQTVAWHLVLCPNSISRTSQLDAINSRFPEFTEILKQIVSQ
jgi:hypothetical protein